MDGRSTFACQVFDHMPLRPQLVMDCFLVCFCAEEILFLARAFSRLPFYDFCFKTLILASYAIAYARNRSGLFFGFAGRDG